MYHAIVGLANGKTFKAEYKITELSIAGHSKTLEQQYISTLETNSKICSGFLPPGVNQEYNLVLAIWLEQSER